MKQAEDQSPANSPSLAAAQPGSESSSSPSENNASGSKDRANATPQGPRRSRWLKRAAWLIAIGAAIWGVAFLLLRDREPYEPPQVFKQVKRDNATSHPLDKALEIAYRQRKHIIANVTDYTAKIVKRERLKGKLGETQIIFAKIRNRKRDKDDKIIAPMSVYLKFLEPKSVRGREVIWVEGANKNRLIAHEAGFKNLLRAKLAPTSVLAMMGNKYPITEIGVQNLIEKLIVRGEEGRKHKDTQVNISKDVELNGRLCTVIEVVHPEKRPEFQYHLARVHLDQELGVPIKYGSYLWPEKTGGELPLEEEYFYDELKLNVGLQDKDFDPDNPDYNYPSW